MTGDGSILICVPPTVGHANHGIALAGVVARSGLRPVLMTGMAVAGHLRSMAPAGLATCCRASYDLNADRTDRSRRPHLEQVCDPDRLRASTRDTLAAIGLHDARLVIGKDQPGSVLAAAAAGLPYAAYATDGAESLVPALSRQHVDDSGRSQKRIGAVAAEFGLAGFDRPLHDLLLSQRLNIVRGLPETFSGPAAGLECQAERLSFVGAITFDGPRHAIDDWAGRLGRLPRPVVYVTFGTVLRDHSRFRALADVAASMPGTMLIASPAPELSELALPANAPVFPYVPNEAALAVADVVVHHGGHGTMLSALAQGVPQIVIPDNERTNQAYHGIALERLGLGVAVPQPEIRASLRAAIEKLRAPGVREEAAAFSGRVRRRTEELCAALLPRLAALADGCRTAAGPTPAGNRNVLPVVAHPPAPAAP